MPRVTQIVQQKNDPGRYSLFIDGQYRLSMTAEGLIDSALTVGRELTEMELQAWDQAAAQAKIMSQAQAYISYKPRTAREVQQRLQKRGIDEHEIDRAVEKLSDVQIIDDEAYARAWVEERLRTKQRSRRQLEAELRGKGVEPSIIDTVLDDLTVDQEIEVLRRLIEKKRRMEKFQDNATLIKYLSTQGYAYDVIKRTFSETCDT